MKNKKNNWFKMEIKNDIAEIYILDPIGYWGVKPKDFIKELKEVSDSKQINLYINCPGGNVFDGLAIYNALRVYKDKLHVFVTGMAASMASIIMLAGSKRTVYKGSYVMVHHPWTWASGNATEIREQADMLDKLSSDFIDIYAKETDLTKDQIDDYMTKETWFKSSEAFKFGFATEEEELEETEAVASIEIDKIYASKFKHLPKNIKVSDPTIRDAEKSLKEIGFSSSQAKGILARGYRDDNKKEEKLKFKEEFSANLDKIIKIF